MDSEHTVLVGQEYDIFTVGGYSLELIIESEDEFYFFVALGVAPFSGLAIPKLEMDSFLNRLNAVLVKEWDDE